MNFRIAFAVLPMLALAACNKGDATGNVTAAAPAASVAAPAGTSWVDTVVRTPEGGFRMGNPDAAVKLIEYGSRSCPHCALFDAEGFPALKAGSIASGKLSYEFRDYPVHGAIDMGPILLGHCVEPGAFFPMLDQMMRSQEKLLAAAQMLPKAETDALATKSPSDVATYLANKLGYVEFVKQRGVPEAKAQACLADGKAIETVAKNADEANQKYNISGTPTFIVNDKVVPNVADWAALQPALKAAGA